MKTSEQINELAAALTKAQSEMEHASKDKTNPHYKSKYADLASCLDACREPLFKNGLSIAQAPQKHDGSWVLVTRLMHTSGQFIESECPIMNAKGDAQGFGSGLTYARRYALSAIIGLAQDDDDGNEAVKRPELKPKPIEPPKPAQVEVQPLSKRHADLSQYTIPTGKFQGKKLGQIALAEIVSYIDFIEVAAKRSEKPITGDQAEVMATIREWVELSNQSIEKALK